MTAAEEVKQGCRELFLGTRLARTHGLGRYHKQVGDGVSGVAEREAEAGEQYIGREVGHGGVDGRNKVGKALPDVGDDAFALSLV